MKWLIAAIGLIAALAGLVFAVEKFSEHERQAGRDEINSKWQAENAARATAEAAFSSKLGTDMDLRFDALRSDLRANYKAGQEIKVSLPPLMTDPRYHSPSCALTPEVLARLNAARALSTPQVAK